MPFSCSLVRNQYRRNAEQMATMIRSGRYRGKVLRQLQDCQARAERCARMTDDELTAHLAACRAQVSARLAAMIQEDDYAE